MTTVVHVITRLELGGAQQNTVATCRGLAAAGRRVALLYGPGGLLDAEAQASPGVELIPVRGLGRRISPAADAQAVFEVANAFRRLRATDPERSLIVHTHSSKAGIVGRAAARLLRIDSVVHSIHGFGFHAGQPAAVQRAFVEAERVASRVTRAFISVSRANLAEAQARGIVTPRHHFRVIRSGMKLEPFFRVTDQRGSCRSKLALGSDPLIVCVANFKPQKDPLTMLQALKALAETHPGARLLYAGDGPLRSAVEAFIAEQGLTERVRLLGWRTDVPDLIGAADVVALSSLFEGLPRTAVQAVAAQRPFVGTRVDGTAEVIRTDREGYLVEPGDPEALARALRRALDRRPHHPEPRHYLKQWSEATLVREQDELYRELEATDAR